MDLQVLNRVCFTICIVCIAIGTPLDKALSGTLTKGIVSAVRMRDGQPLIQSDVVVNPGNSGGPLIDLSGRLVGVSSAKMAFTPQGVPTQGLGFAIPAETVRASVAQFKTVAQNKPPPQEKAAPTRGSDGDGLLDST